MVQFQTKRKAGFTAPDDWPVEVIGRTGLPPLRFASRTVAHVRTVDRSMFIKLHERKRGGYVVWHTSFVDDALGEAAQTCPTLIDAVTYLEGLCRKTAMGPLESTGSLFETNLANLAFDQRFAVLAGEALALWDDICGPFDET